MVQIPPPPSITPRQMNLLRIVTAMAWSDGDLAEEEVEVMLDRFSQIFATPSDQQQLRQELQDYMMQNIGLEELTPKLQSTEEKELALRLGYEVIAASARTPEEDKINTQEVEAYQKLVSLLGLPSETIQRIEGEAASTTYGSWIDGLAQQIKQFVSKAL